MEQIEAISFCCMHYPWLLDPGADALHDVLLPAVLASGDLGSLNIDRLLFVACVQAIGHRSTTET